MTINVAILYSDQISLIEQLLQTLTHTNHSIKAIYKITCKEAHDLCDLLLRARQKIYAVHVEFSSDPYLYAIVYDGHTEFTKALLTRLYTDVDVGHVESHVEDILKALRIGPADKYGTRVIRGSETSWACTVTDYTRTTVSVDSLYLRYVDDDALIALKDSCHFKFVTSRSVEYIAYWMTYHGTKLIEYYSPAQFNNLIISHKESKSTLVLVRQLNENQYEIVDGIHSAAITATRRSTIEVGVAHD